MVLYAGYIEYEIVFLQIWQKINHPKENIHRGTKGVQKPNRDNKSMRVHERTRARAHTHTHTNLAPPG